MALEPVPLGSVLSKEGPGRNSNDTELCDHLNRDTKSHHHLLEHRTALRLKPLSSYVTSYGLPPPEITLSSDNLLSCASFLA